MVVKVCDDDARRQIGQVAWHERAVLRTGQVTAVVASCTKLADLTSRGAVNDNTAALVVDDGHSALPVARGTDALRSLQPRAAQLPHVVTSRTTDT